MTKRFKIGLDLITIEDTSKEYGALNQDEVVDELNRLNDENEQLKKENQDIKQLINQMLRQIQAEKINTNHPRFSATIIFTFDEYQKIKEIWKSDLR